MEEVVVEGEEGKDDEDEGNSISKLVNHRSTPTSSDSPLTLHAHQSSSLVSLNRPCPISTSSRFF